MQDIINATGMSQGAIYRYYKNIDEILCFLVLFVVTFHMLLLLFVVNKTKESINTYY